MSDAALRFIKDTQKKLKIIEMFSTFNNFKENANDGILCKGSSINLQAIT